MSTEVKRTTIALPQDLLRVIDRVVGEGKAHSRSEFVATALQHELDALERLAIDAAFAEMATDSEYAREVEQIAQEFAHAAR